MFRQAAVGVLAVVVFGTAGAAEPSSPLVLRAYWANLDWTRVEDAPVVRDLPARAPDVAEGDAGDQDRSEAERKARRIEHQGLAIRQGVAKVFGRDAKVSLQERPGAARYGRGILVEGEAGSLGECAEVLNALERSLGRSAISHDFSRTWANADVAHRRAQWTFGGTRLGFFCYALARKGRPEDTPVAVAFWDLFAWHKSVEPEDRPLTWIRCAWEMTTYIQGERRVRTLPEMSLAIDEYGGDVFSENLSRFANTVNVTPKRISFAIIDEKSGMRREGSINRATGAYDEAIVGSDTVISGKCSKFDPRQKAF